MDYKFEQTQTGRMKVKEEFTPARRWSFLVGANENSHTAQSRLVDILPNDEHSPTLAELEQAFDIETVTREFFIKYRELFIRTKEELDKIVAQASSLQNEFKSKGVDTVNFAKKLLGQIVFLYFLQKKGWFGVARDAAWGTGSKRFLRELFEKRVTQAFSLSSTNTNREQDACDTINFFNDILEPLFYEALRIDRSHDDHYYSRFNFKIPFLNGGLFDPIGSNGGYDRVHTDICIPDSLFSNKNKTKEGDKGDGILDIFDRYNFTVREDEPLEKEVAIDPELLGKAYEKFNAIRPDNFEEYKKALKSGKKGEESKFNKQYGVYYTPREIVHYMCQQSLINYLHTELADSNSKSDRVSNPVRVNKVSKEDIETLIHVGEQVSENEETALIKEQKILEGKQKSSDYKVKLPESIRKNAILIDQKLADITVCDPAVGSGAFPVGMMSEIVKARNALMVYFKGDGDTDIPVCDNNDTTTDRNVCVTTITRRNLPHWTKEGSIYWITFRLADSLPQEKLNTWKDERDLWISKHREPWSETEWKEYGEQFEKRLESWLDSGYGSCVLAQPEVRRIVQECLLRFNEERLQLHAAVIMPNHVHLLLEPLAGNSLSELLKGIKGASARKINQMLGTTGSKFWMDESYDHIVRSEAQYQRFIRYIAENPVKANLSEDKYWLYHGSTGIPASDQPKDTQTIMSEPDRPQTRMSVLRSTYNFKRHCIEHSLYGVDIDPGAVEIAKLRLWLSLVVDEDDIKNIKPLPNLDYKIVCGNSLLGVKKNLFNSHLFSKLEKIKPLYFNETNPTKKQDYKKQIDELISQITNGHKEFDFEIYFSEVFHASSNSPLAKGDTGGCRGFDVVIANPPYGAKIDGVALKKTKQNLSDTTNSNSAAIFIDYGKNRLIGEKGTLTFIVPKSLLYSENWFSLVKSMLGNVSILVDVEKAFENVKLEQVVFVYSKSIHMKK